MDSESDSEPMFPYNPEDDIFSSAFNYEDQLRTSPLLRSILDSDIESVKARIQSGKDLLHGPNNYGNTPLHAAAVQSSTEILNLLLQLPEIDLNFKNDMGDTPLLLSMKLNQPDDFIMQLLEAGSDINIADNEEEKPLHFAVTRSSSAIALQLIKKNADINAVDGNMYTPLHHAVVGHNLELVCMLLYYNADVEIECFHKLTAFMYAVNDGCKLEIARVLFNCYVDFSSITTDGYTALLLAANSITPIAVNIAKAGADVNWIVPQGDSVLLFALHYDNSELFKTVWPKFDQRNLLYTNVPFLFTYIRRCCYPTSEWVECMYEILNSPFIVDLIAHCTNYIKPNGRITFFKTLYHTMFKLKVKLSDRLTIIQLYLSFGAPVFIRDINLVNDLYGFNEELEIFIQLGTIQDKMNRKFEDSYFSLPAFIFAQEENYSAEYVFKLFENQILQQHAILEAKASAKNIAEALGFFSFPHNIKETLSNSDILSPVVKDAILTKFSVIPDIPSLLELSRNQVRKNIKENHAIKRPYEFHDAVNNLDIPPLIKNIILFKTPIYG